jgi:hypothetical protein
MQMDNINLADLSDDLQKQFGYVPSKTVQTNDNQSLLSSTPSGMTPSELRWYYANSTLQRRQDEADEAARQAEIAKEQAAEALKERTIEAQEKEAQAAMIQAQKPPDQVNVIQVQ